MKCKGELMAKNNSQVKDLEQPIIEAKVNRLIDKPDSKVKAILTVNIGNSFAIHGVKVIDSKNGLFVQMPQREYEDKGRKMFADIFHPITADARSLITDEVFRAFDEKLVEYQDFEDEMSQELPFNQSM